MSLWAEIMSDPLEVINKRAGEMLDAEMPTLSEAWACLNCEAVRRTLHNGHYCVVCGSESVVDIADMFLRNLRTEIKPPTPTNPS